MLARLSLKSEPLWLQPQRPSYSLYHPLLLLPGDGGEGVQVEAALLLASSSLLRRVIISSSCCCNSSAMTVMLPSSTSATLEHLAQILVHGSVTLAMEALADFGALLTLLEVDMERTSCGKKATSKTQKEKWKVSSSASPRLLSPPPTPPTASRKSTSGNIKTGSGQCPPSISSDPPPKKTLRAPLTTPSPVSSLLISIPFKSLSSETVHRITATQENLTLLSSSEAKPGSSKPDEKDIPSPRLCPRLCPKQDEKDIPLPILCPTRPPLPGLCPSRPSVTCIFCDTTMPIGTDQGSYLQHLEVPLIMYSILILPTCTESIG